MKKLRSRRILAVSIAVWFCAVRKVTKAAGAIDRPSGAIHVAFPPQEIDNQRSANMKNTSLGMGLVALVYALAASAALAAPTEADRFGASEVTAHAGRDASVPLKNWRAPKTYRVAKNEGAPSSLKAATHYATVYRPVTPCRLVDTRGNGAPVTLGTVVFTGGAAPNGNVKTVNPNGACGIPTSAVRALSLSFHVFNYTTSNGGYISFSGVGGSAGAAHAVFNTGAVWTAATTNVPSGVAGAFDAHVIQSNVELIVDVNGYYQDLDDLDIGSQQLDIVGNSSGSTLDIWNTGTGAALGLEGTGPGAKALNIYSGSVNAAGAGVNTSSFAFIHQVNTTPFASGGTGCPGYPHHTVIDHPMLNGKSNAIVTVTARSSNTGVILSKSYGAYYLAGSAGCGAGSADHWLIHDTTSGALANGSQFSVLIINAD